MRLARTFSLYLWTALLATTVFSGAPRLDRWEVLGPGGGGGQFLPTISPHNTNAVLVSGDMTGCFLSHDGGRSWRMFNLGNAARFFLFDPVDAKVMYAKTFGPPPLLSSDRPFARAALWRSSDAGRTWRLLHSDSPEGSVTALGVDPADSATLYAAFQKGKDSTLQVSSDRGRTWHKVADLADGGDKIYIDPRSPKGDRTVYVIGIQSVAVREGGRWQTGEPLAGMAVVDGRPELHGRLVSAGFPKEGGKLVVYGVTRGRLMVSDDGGRAWRDAALPSIGSPVMPVAVATSLNHPDVAYLSYITRRGAPERAFGVVKTTDRGRTWEVVWKDTAKSAPNVHDSWLGERYGPGWGGNPIYLGVAPADPRICFGTDYGRTMRTIDGGKTWDAVYSTKLADGTFESTGLDVTTGYGVHFDPFDTKRVFLSFDDIGLVRSENGGKSWVSSTDGIPEPWINSTYWIVFDPEVRGRAWGVMSGVHSLPRHKLGFLQPGFAEKAVGGVCRSEDGAKTWANSSEGMPPNAVTHILLDPRSPAGARTLYVTGFARGVFKSNDGGGHWALKNDGIAGKEPFAWRLAQASDGTLYLVVVRRNDDGSIGGDGDGALYQSTDGAENWTKMKLPEDVNGPHSLEVDPRDPRRLYLGAWGRHPDSRGTVGGGIYLSIDSGATWRQVLAQDQYIHDVTVDPRNPKIVYACGFESSAWRSGDRGVSWRRIPGYNFKWGRRVVPDAADPGRIYVTTYGGSVWRGPAEGDGKALEDTVPPPAKVNWP